MCSDITSRIPITIRLCLILGRSRLLTFIHPFYLLASTLTPFFLPLTAVVSCRSISRYDVIVPLLSSSRNCAFMYSTRLGASSWRSRSERKSRLFLISMGNKRALRRTPISKLAKSPYRFPFLPLTAVVSCLNIARYDVIAPFLSSSRSCAFTYSTSCGASSWRSLSERKSGSKPAA